MARVRDRRCPFRRLSWLLAIIVILVVSAYALYPYLYTVFSGQQYINPRVSLKAHESYELEFWVRLPSIANTPFQEA